ncbi:manganese ion binding protein [Aureococcus anophagefferens]|uniref:Manganese ion binding protein n=1 Tax=Aureococcus anophagefferens TaxID=44056 RepID=A0ABR1G9X9_AURAN
MQGWRADHEDAHFMRNGGGNAYDLFGVLDGHGGSEAARLAAHQKLPELLRAACGGASKAFGELEKRVAAAFVETDAWLRARPEVLRDQSGSTCVVGGVRKLGENAYGAFLANAGDSRGLVVRRSARAAAAASDDHKPDRDDEMRRIADAGGFVSDADAARSGAQHVVARLDGNLAVSRGLGDFAYKKDPRLGPGQQKVSCVPECYDVGLGGSSEPLAAGDLLILACDGIFDVMSNEQLVAAVVDALDAGADVGDVCARVVGSCLRDLHSKDNMTLMVVEIGVDGSAYCYAPEAAKKRSRADSASLEGGDVDMADADDSDDDDDDGDGASEPAPGIVVDEIVGLDKYDRQSDDAVKRSYVAFLEYCLRSGNALPWEAARSSAAGRQRPRRRRAAEAPRAPAPARGGAPAAAGAAPGAAAGGGGPPGDADLDDLVKFAEGDGAASPTEKKKKKKKKKKAGAAPPAAPDDAAAPAA